MHAVSRLIIPLIIILNAGPASAKLSLSEQLGIDSLTLTSMRPSIRSEPAGMIVARVYDQETKEKLKEVETSVQLESGEFSRPIRYFGDVRRKPGYYSFRYAVDGYTTLTVDNIRIAVDTATVVDVYLRRGTDSVLVKAGKDRRAKVKMVDLSEISSKVCTVTGRIRDAAAYTPVVGAHVVFEETGKEVRTDDSGLFAFSIDTLYVATLDIWHPLYDSIHFTINNREGYQRKTVNIDFERQRRSKSSEGTNSHPESSILFLLTSKSWGGKSIYAPTETVDLFRTYSVAEGDTFGPGNEVSLFHCNPFRLIRILSDSSVWVEYSPDLVEEGKGWGSRANLACVGAGETVFGTPTLDAGTVVRIGIQPEYSPDQTELREDSYSTSHLSSADKAATIGPCDSIEAVIERIHLTNMLAFFEGDFRKFASGFSPTFSPSENKQGLPLDEFYRRAAKGKIPDRVAGKRVGELVDIAAEKFYIMGMCGDTVGEHFWGRCEPPTFVPQAGDIYIQWPGDFQSAVIYRKQDDGWKIVAFTR